MYPTPPFDPDNQEIPGSESKMSPTAHHGATEYEGNNLLLGQVAVITGGDSGIGRSVALTYAREGAKIFFTYLSEDDDAAETVRLVRESGAKCEALKINHDTLDACEKTISRALETFGTIDILVNNAAHQQTFDDYEKITEEELERTYRTNILAYFYLSRAALRHMRKGGSIINTASIQAHDPSPNLLPYASTKASIINFTKSFAHEAIKKGVRVNAVSPGPVWTPLIPSTMPKEKVQQFGKNTLFERPAQPIELAPIYVFLASSLASYVTAEEYGVTGGRAQL